MLSTYFVPDTMLCILCLLFHLIFIKSEWWKFFSVFYRWKISKIYYIPKSMLGTHLGFNIGSSKARSPCSFDDTMWVAFVRKLTIQLSGVPWMSVYFPLTLQEVAGGGGSNVGRMRQVEKSRRKREIHRRRKRWICVWIYTIWIIVIRI